jgi:hypothetical protein
MIDARELRIGNWVIIKDANKNFDEEYKIPVEANHLSDIESSNYYAIGIPLTPEILEKAGAIRKYGNTWYLGKLRFELNSTGKIIRFHYSGKVVYLDYVHQLQNLYWCLSGKELEIKL